MERESEPFRSTNERLKIRWNKLLRTLSAQSETFWLDLAVNAFRHKEYDDALVNLYQALALRPYNAVAYKLKGMILQFKAFDTTDADHLDILIPAMVEAYERAIRIEPSLRADIDQRLRHLYLLEYKRGERAFESALVDRSLFRRAATHFNLAARIRDVLIDDLPAPDTPWNAYVNQALAHLQAGERKEAACALESAVERGDRSLKTTLLLADLYEEQEAYEKAVRVLEETWRAPKADHEPLEAPLLNAYLRAGLNDRALPIYDAALALEPTNQRYRYNYGTLLLEQRAYDEAAKHLRVAVRLDARDVQAQFNLGVAYFNKAVGSKSAGHTTAHRELSAAQPEVSDLFRQAAGPLEHARSLMEENGEEATDLYILLRALYTQIGEADKAAALTGLLDENTPAIPRF